MAMPNNQTRYVILVGDGMGDFPLPELDGKTPLEAAATPAMDFLSIHGDLARLATIPEGFPPGSDVANLSVLGYRPEGYYTGRAPLEAASMGVTLAADEIAMRCNLVTLGQGADGAMTMIDYSAGHIGTEEARELIMSLDQALGNAQLRLHPGVSYRHLLVYKGDLHGLKTVPPHDHTGRDVSEYWQRYLALPVFRDFLPRARALLAGHEVNRQRRAAGKAEANGLWLWGEGRPPAMPTLQERYGLSGALISAVDLLKGIGVYAGMEVIKVPNVTGYLDTNYEGKASAALTALNDRDLVLVHVEAPDEASHQGLLREKMQAIEDFDRRIVGPIVEGLRKAGHQFRIAVLMDHYTPLSLKTHAALPVPVVLYDSREARPGSGLGYSEANAESTARFFPNGQEFMDALLEGRG